MKHEASLQRFLPKLKQKIFLIKMNMINCFLLLLFLLVSKFTFSDTFPKLRPIVSSVGTFNYDLSRFLRDLLAPVVPDDYSCKDTFSSFSFFFSHIKNANFSAKFLVSYDVTSLFTNIPL